MGCAESSETVSIDADEEAEPTTKPGGLTARKQKVRKKSKRRSKSVRSTESETGPEQADSTTIHVIWRRISVFGGRRDSTRSNNSGELDKAGPSPKPLSGP